MNREEFLEELVELMMLESRPGLSTELSSIAEWDSMTRLALLSLLEDNLNIQVDAEDLAELTTIQELVDLAGL